MSIEAGLRDEWYAFVWEQLGKRVAVTFERAGVEDELVGTVVCHADGSYDVGSTRLIPGEEGFPVRWASLSQVQLVSRPYDWEREDDE